MMRTPKNPAYSVRREGVTVTVSHKSRGDILNFTVYNARKIMGPRWDMLDHDASTYDRLPDYVKVAAHDAMFSQA